MVIVASIVQRWGERQGDPGEKAYNDESGLNVSDLIWSFFSRLGDDVSWNDIPLTTPE